MSERAVQREQQLSAVLSDFARTMLTAGSTNTLPLEIVGMTTNVTSPVLYALGTVTTGISLAAIAVTLLVMRRLRRRLGH